MVYYYSQENRTDQILASRNTVQMFIDGEREATLLSHCIEVQLQKNLDAFDTAGHSYLYLANAYGRSENISSSNRNAEPSKDAMLGWCYIILTKTRSRQDARSESSDRLQPALWLYLDPIGDLIDLVNRLVPSAAMPSMT